ncbi:MAG: FAD-dependent oxidoreductase [Halarcobacter sp.]
MFKTYDYIIIGAGIAGCSTAYFLSKHSKSVLLIDRNCDVAQAASGAAGAFLSPLLGKENKFKELVSKSLKFSTSFYKENIPEEINNCGVVRIPKNEEDRKKFESYKPFMDFPYEEEGEGYFFEIGSQVNAYGICNFLAKNVEKAFDYEVNNIKKEDDKWLVNSDYQAKNLILTTGADVELIEEDYFKIRAVWGQKIDVYTSNVIKKNYHKECSLSSSKFIKEKNKNRISIGATHHRLTCDVDICNLCIQGANINKTSSHSYSLDTLSSDTQKLLKLANEIQKLDDVEVCDVKVGARASSVDYFPMLGKLIDSEKTIKAFPHLKNGSFIKDEMLSSIDNLFVLNGVGGRGYVLSPYLAKNLVDHIIKDEELNKDVTTQRLFKRWVKKHN